MAANVAFVGACEAAPLSIIHQDTQLGLALAGRGEAPCAIARAMFGYVHRARRKGWASPDCSRPIQYLLHDPRP